MKALTRALAALALTSMATALGCTGAGALGMFADDEVPQETRLTLRDGLPMPAKTGEWELAGWYAAIEQGLDPAGNGLGGQHNPLACWPVEGVREISSPYGMRRTRFGGWRMHKGIDVGAPHGTTVYAAGDAVVIEVGRNRSFGRWVLLEHDRGVRTRYAHLSAVLVDPGKVLACGETLGRVGSTGRSTGPHLHFEVISAGLPTDPMSWIDPYRHRHAGADERLAGNLPLPRKRGDADAGRARALAPFSRWMPSLPNQPPDPVGGGLMLP